jgi:hypothetical protein
LPLRQTDEHRSVPVLNPYHKQSQDKMKGKYYEKAIDNINATKTIVLVVFQKDYRINIIML